MTVFFSTLNQMAFLLLLILIGYLLCKLKAVPETGAGILSRLENNVFIPALVMGTFIKNFTLRRLNVAWLYFLGGFALVAISIVLAFLIAHLLSKDDYTRKIYIYGLAFPNFAFMGNAVVSALFPEVFMEYLIFTLPFWIMIYLWGVPALLIPSDQTKNTLKSRLKSFLNPMFIAMMVGMVVGLINPPLPAFLQTSVETLGNCMSPIAMLLTGMTIAKIDLKATFKNLSIYAVSLVRVFLLPAIAVVVISFLPLSKGLAICSVCLMAMPLGLNTIVIPSAYGRDTSVAAGMALISHLLSCVSIPLIFVLYEYLTSFI